VETIIALALGAITGCGASRTHPSVDRGALVGIGAGGLGGIIGGAALGGLFAPMLSDTHLAGVAVGAAVGGIALSLGAGFALNVFWPR